MKKILVSILILTAVTLASVSNVFADYHTENRTLYQGMSSNYVKDLQMDLKDLNYFNANPTGYFGSITKQSVIAYQRSKGLVADGIVGSRTARAIKVDKVLQTAKYYQGTPYVWGGASPSGFDCSGFVQYVLSRHEILIPRNTGDQYNTGMWVDKSQLKPGDLVFFTTYKPGPSHVGMYIGNNKFLHASSGEGKITIANLDNPYFSPRYIGARRVIK